MHGTCDHSYDKCHINTAKVGRFMILSDDQHLSTTFGTTKNIFFKNDNCDNDNASI